MASGLCGWHKTVSVGDRYAHIHITQADYSVRHGYHVWLYAPRIGIDFRKTRKYRGKHFISNIDIGELVRFIRILRIMRSKDVQSYFDRGKLNKFIIEQTPDRRIRFKIVDGNVLLEYKHTDWDNYSEIGTITPDRISKLANTLEDAFDEYLRLIRTWHRDERLPGEYKHRVD